MSWGSSWAASWASHWLKLVATPAKARKMYTGTLGTVSNREDWDQEITVFDDDDEMDISSATIVMAVGKKGCTPILTASVGSGISVSSPEFTFSFTEAQMRSLCASQYEVGCTIKLNGKTRQFIAGTVTVIDGVVP